MRLLCYLLPGLLALATLRAGAQPLPPVPADTIPPRLAPPDFQESIELNKVIFKVISLDANISSGYGLAHYDGLNAQLSGAGLPTLGNSQLTTGLGGSFRFWRVVLGLEGLWASQRNTTPQYQLTASSTTALPYLGFAWFARDYSRALVPMLGVGINELDVSATGLTPAAAPTTAGLLGGPAYSRTLHYQSFSLALGAQYTWFPFDSNLLKRSLLGLRVQYLTRLGSGSYYATDFRQTTTGPACDPLRFSARATVGFCF